MNNERERRMDALAELLGIPENVRDDLKRLSIIQARINTCLSMNKAISTKDLEEYNALCYKHFADLQDGSEFEKEEPEEGPKECPKPAETVDFGAAIRDVKAGYRYARKGWNGKGQYIELARNIKYDTEIASGEWEAHHEDIGSKAIVFVGTRGSQIGWLASQADMLADDWYPVT